MTAQSGTIDHNLITKASPRAALTAGGMAPGGIGSVEHPQSNSSPAPQHNAFLESALWYASRNVRVFPLHSPLPEGICDCHRTPCSSAAKHPRTMRGLLDATLDPQQIRDWWAMWPRANVGIVTGQASNLVVIDVDPRHGGDATLQKLCEEYGYYHETREVRTGGGGYHLYFRPPSMPIASGNGVLGPGVDLKAEGGYVVAPPSIHISGRPYRWSDPVDIKIAPLPEWVRTARFKRASQPNPDGWVAPALASLQEGNRNETFTRLAGLFRRYGLTVADIVAILQPHAEDCGLNVAELYEIAVHVGRYPPEPPVRGLSVPKL